MQLREGSFEIPSATRAEHHISAKHDFRRDECEVVIKVARYLDDVKNDTQCVKVELVSFAQVMSDMRIFRMASPVHRHVIYSAKFFDAADVVMVAVGTQDAVQLQPAHGKKIQHGLCLSRINHRSGTVVVDGPDVVILQSGNGGDFEHES